MNATEKFQLFQNPKLSGEIRLEKHYGRTINLKFTSVLGGAMRILGVESKQFIYLLASKTHLQIATLVELPCNSFTLNDNIPWDDITIVSHDFSGSPLPIKV